MTAARYESYLSALALIGALEERTAAPTLAETLRQSAEDLLLSRGHCREAQEALEAAALALTQLILIDATSRSLADAIMEALHASGPQSSPRARGVAASASHAHT